MLTLKELSPENNIFGMGRWFLVASRQLLLARHGERRKPTRDLSPCRALQVERVVTQEIRLPAYRTCALPNEPNQ